MESYHFNTTLQLRYSDFDMLGHMNSAQYVTLIEFGRLQYFMRINWDLTEISNVVASFKIDYLTQILPSDEVEIWVRVATMGNKSFKMEYLMASPDEKTIYAKAESVQVCIRKEGNTATPIPDHLRDIIESFEKQ